MQRDTQPTAVEPPTTNPGAPPLPAPAPSNGPEQDPLATWTAPPPDESPQEYTVRHKAEADAKKKSELIDENIKAERARLKQEQKLLVKVLLVGQSESGKSTVLKNFRMRYARQAWRDERRSWTPVVQLNLVQAVSTICEAILAEAQAPSSPARHPNTHGINRTHKSSHSLARSDAGLSLAESDEPTEHSHPSSVTLITPALNRERAEPIHITDVHLALCARLKALKNIEALLVERLGEATWAEEPREELGVMGLEDGDGRGALSEDTPASLVRKRMKRTGDLTVKSWSHVLASSRASSPIPLSRDPLNVDTSLPVPNAVAADDARDPGQMLAAHREDIQTLWGDECVQRVLERRSIRLAEEAGGFFLHEIYRIATLAYEPSDDDIVRARLRTLGPQEYRLKFEGGILTAGMEMGREWAIYDIGGSRTMRHAWLPFFAEVNALIFLAPISCFDERLTESPSTNRLEDSFLLWAAICSSELLKNATFIVFLNKVDLLEEKLARGVQVSKYLPSYGERRNEVPVLVKYLKGKFRDTAAQFWPQRILYVYATAAVDTKATAATLKSVRDGILREHLKTSDLF
ncbi:G-alpha-domain-containing protein [Athelia psychrophila]|uniref:G-alpha-domain-containing protein n=1 Tax=Athelia psychrophila TaxID=1759441 RepID=A0A166B390_9AGAM|nr:G-alpha-domain-containing protein [Fibularhizoctonia sp. CBS 109695]